MSAEARFLVTTAADLLVATSRLQTASKEAVYLFFLGIFWAFSGWKDIESQTVTETVTETLIFWGSYGCGYRNILVRLQNKEGHSQVRYQYATAEKLFLTPGNQSVFTAFHGVMHESFLQR